MESAVKMCPKCSSKNIFIWMGAEETRRSQTCGSSGRRHLRMQGRCHLKASTLSPLWWRQDCGYHGPFIVEEYRLEEKPRKQAK